MQWATRKGVKSDRLACIWLIKRFVDPNGEILLLDEQDILSLTAAGVNTFDAQSARFTHVPATDGTKYGERCSFQSIAEAFEITNGSKAIDFLGRIIHAADIGHRIGCFEPKEGYGLWAITQGLSLTTEKDEDRIRIAMPLFDALYAYSAEITANG